MKTSVINQLINGENVTVKNVPNITTQEQALNFITEVGKAAREIANKEKSFYTNSAMREIEECYRAARKGKYGNTDGGYGMYVASSAAFGWLKKMYIYSTTGSIEL